MSYEDIKIRELAERRAHEDRLEVFSESCLSCVAHYDHIEKIATGRAKDWAQLVTDFQRPRGETIPEYPVGAIDPRVVVLRLRLMAEELGETAAALHEQDLEKIADGLCDLLYVTVGTAVAYGLGPILDTLFREVARSNQTKVSGAFAPGLKYAAGEGKGQSYDPPRLAEI